MQNSNRPRRLVKPFGSLAGSTYIAQVPVAPQPNGRASYDTGFPPETFQPVASGGSPPSGADMNGVLFDATAAASWQAAGGMAMFDSAFASAVGGYPMYAQLAGVNPGVIWQSIVDNNTTDPDSASASGWVQTTVNANGTDNFYRLPGGIIEQWGQVDLSSTGQPVVGVSLIVPFRDAFYNVSLTPIINAPSTNRDSWVQMVTTSRTAGGFSVQYQDSANNRAGLDGFMWRAVGR